MDFDFLNFMGPQNFSSPGQPTNGGFDFGGFRDDSFSSFMNPIQNLMPQIQGMMPQTQNFMDTLRQVPQMQDFKPSIGRGILAGLAGLAASFNSPQAGAEAASSIAGAPYNRAMGDYQTKVNALGRGAQAEQGMLGLARQFGNDQFQRDQFGQELGFKKDQLGQQGRLAGRELDIKGQDLELRREQAKLDRALQEKKISIDQYQAATQRLNANTNASEANTRGQYYKDLIEARKNPVKAPSEPNAAMTELRMGAMIQSDPILSKFINKDGNLKVHEMDEAALGRLLQIQQQLGIIPRQQGNNRTEVPIPFNPMFTDIFNR